MKPLLPEAPELRIAPLAASFDNVTNSYKFYWFLAILDYVRENGERVIEIDDLLARMLSSVWYPVNYFRLSFGKLDQLGKVIELLAEEADLPASSPRHQVFQTAIAHLKQRDKVGRNIRSLRNFVPYRFLRPFFAEKLRRAKDWKVNRLIRHLADEAFFSSEPCLYRFLDAPETSIELHPAWYDYFREYLSILTGFALWHLTKYMQRNNPNVPGITAKLFEPQTRNLGLARRFWRHVLMQGERFRCIFSGQILSKDDFSLDHFLPWRFVTHDLLWNLIPVPQPVNSSKGDNLPHPDYLNPFVEIQYRALQIMLRTRQQPKLFEDYVSLFKVSSLKELQSISFIQFRDTLHDTIAPQLQIAANMGFVMGWRYVQ